MAKNLNKSRIILSRFIIISLLVSIFFVSSWIVADGPLHQFLDVAGTVLVAFCALGRLYTSAYLGGFKNNRLMISGPFSLVRNPLYFFSLVGFTGIALMTNKITIMILFPLSFLIIYIFLIRREEIFLKKKFGEEYEIYKCSTPRLFPSLRRYHAPDIMEFHPRFLNKAFMDAIWWFAAFPLIEIAEYIQEQNLLPKTFLLP